jgi:3-oxoacyl-[acyl-carrier-protein] synthase II
VYVHLAGKAFELRGFSTSVHNACTSGAFAIEVAAERIRSGQADAMLVAGGEAFDTGVRLEWFRRLGLYAAKPADMRPFDSETGGFYVGEGAGAMLLESESHARRRGARVYAEYVAGAFQHQAWKQTVPDVRAARLARAISDALEQAGASAPDIDLIVPHGAATTISDGYEAECLSRAFSKSRVSARAGAPGPMVTAFKPYVGHMLAASGILDTICGLLAVRHGLAPATPNSAATRSALPVPLIVEPIETPIRTMLKLSTGFTGHDAALVFRAV